MKNMMRRDFAVYRGITSEDIGEKNTIKAGQQRQRRRDLTSFAVHFCSAEITLELRKLQWFKLK